jgi:hypothetical protein
MLFDKKKFGNVRPHYNRDHGYPTRSELARLLRLYGLNQGGCIMEPLEGGGYRCHVAHPDDLRALQLTREVNNDSHI